MDRENKHIEELLKELPLHDASDEVVSDLLEKVEATPISAATVSRSESLKERLLSFLKTQFSVLWDLINRRRFASIAIAACSLMLVLNFFPDSTRKRRLRPIANSPMMNVGSHLGKQSASEQGTGARDAYGDLIVAFKNEIETAKKERSEMNKVLQRVVTDSGEPNVGSHPGEAGPSGSLSEAEFSEAEPSDFEDRDSDYFNTSNSGRYNTPAAVDALNSIEDRLYPESQQELLADEVADSRGLAYGNRADRLEKDGGAYRDGGVRGEAFSTKPTVTRDGVAFKTNSRLVEGKKYRLPQRSEVSRKSENELFAEAEQYLSKERRANKMAPGGGIGGAFGSAQTFSGNTSNLLEEIESEEGLDSDAISYKGENRAVPGAKNIPADKVVLGSARPVLRSQKRMSKDFLNEKKSDSIRERKQKAQSAGQDLSGAKRPIRKSRESEASSRRKSAPAVNEGYLAQEFLKRYEGIDGLRFKEAAGYWSNSYVPGSPSVRRLRAALQKTETPSLRMPDPTLYAHDLAHQTYQPFDAPKNAALAVYLHSNRTGLQGKQRMILQVGLKASERRSGRRPAMNIGVVLDLRKLPAKQELEDMRSLLFALNKQKDIGDRFSVTVAGRGGGTLIPASTFGHGHLSVAFKKFASAPAGSEGGLSLTQAIKQARDEVSRSDDPSAPLGSSSIMLVTASSVRSQLKVLTQQAHAHALEGITTSVLGVGNKLRPRELEQIALSGQGRRSILSQSNDAKSIIVKELNAVSQVVARAVRLRIRLAPGVKLIDVLGSRRLDEPAAERVRQAEKSIDQRISRNLGIEADRGEDEEGIQIVIPAFYAGDAHVVLLDVIAPGPGAVSDVQIRYKDLVFMKNGVARANLSLSRSESVRGPLEQNVLKNLLAFSLSEKLKLSAKLMMSNQFAEARRILTEQRALLQSFQASVAGFERDRGIRNDLQMLERYLQSLGAVSGAASAKPIALSLQYAGTQRVLPEILTE